MGLAVVGFTFIFGEGGDEEVVVIETSTRDAIKKKRKCIRKDYCDFDDYLSVFMHALSMSV